MRQHRHPEDDKLLRYVDGELPAAETSQVRDHLAACTRCQANVNELESIFADCVRYKLGISDNFPSPTAPWRDIYSGFAEVDAMPGSNSFSGKIVQGIRNLFAAPMRWTPVAAGLVATIFIVTEFTNAPSAKAAELLRQAVKISEARPAQARKIQFRTKHTLLTRTISDSKPMNVAESAALAEVESLFRNAHYDWTDPLSAKAFSDWRDRQPSRHDEVKTANEGIEIRTATDSGEISLASLTLRRSDMQALASMLEFRNHEFVEIRDVSSAIDTGVATARSLGDSSGNRLASPDTAVETKPAPVTAGDELQVWATLRSLNADLGEPLEVSRQADRILVKGIGIAPNRRTQIAQAFVGNPRIALEFQEPSTASITEHRSAAMATLNPQLAPLQEKMARIVGGRATFEQFADGVMAETDSLLSHAHALKRLAERFPAGSQLSADQQQVLNGLCQEHINVLWQKIAVIQGRMNPVLSDLAAPIQATVSSFATSTSWQEATEELLRDSRNADSLLAVMLGSATGDATVDQLPAKVSRGLAVLKARISAYRDRYHVQ